MYNFYKAARIVLKPLFHILYRPVIIGRENIPAEGATVIAGNHMHALDPMMVDISTKRVVRSLAKKQLHDGPFGGFFRSVGTIPVDFSKTSSPASLSAAFTALKSGELINLFPEARRNYTDELLLQFKPGAAAMAVRTGAVIVPFAVTGGYKIFSGPRPKIVFGKPFAAPGDINSTNKTLYEKTAELLKQNMSAEELEAKHYTPYQDVKRRKKT